MPRFQIVLVLVSFAAGILWFQPPTTDKNQPKESASDAHLKSLVDSSEEPSRNTGAPEATFAKSPFEKVEDGEPTLISVSKTPVSEQLPIDPTQDRPDVVLQALVDLPLTGSSEAELLNRLKSWSEDSADDAALWIETTLSGAEPESAAYALRHSFLNLWLKIEPEVALQRLELFADEDELPYLIADHVVRLADEHNSQYALNWAESSTEGAVRSRAVKDALDHWLTHDADGLAAELLVRIDEGKKTQQNTPQVDEILSNMGDRLVDKLAEQDPVKALNWAERLPSDQVETAQERVAGEWLKQDAVSAHQWLDSVLADTGTLPTGVASAIPFADIDLALATWNVVEDSAREAMTEGIVETQCLSVAQ